MMIGQSEREQFGHAYVVVALNYIYPDDYSRWA
jgi:hypothetical protein